MVNKPNAVNSMRGGLPCLDSFRQKPLVARCSTSLFGGSQSVQVAWRQAIRIFYGSPSTVVRSPLG